MKLEDSSTSAMTPTNSSPDLAAKQQINNKLARQAPQAPRDRYKKSRDKHLPVLKGTDKRQPNERDI